MSDEHKERCFACDRPIAAKRYMLRARTSDGQIVFVGADCFIEIRIAGENGYQPPKGGPRLYVLKD